MVDFGRHRVVGEPVEHAVDADGGRGAGGEQQVGSVAVGNGLQQHLDTFIHAARQCTVGDVGSGQVLVVSADERWLRVLEVTLRLGGADTISRRSAREALSLASGDTSVSAIVLDLAQATADELEVARGLLGHSSLPAVVILPERLAAQSEAFAAVGATVLVRPYRPSELYDALQITDAEAGDDTELGESSIDSVAGEIAAGEPDELAVDAEPDESAAEPVPAAATDPPADAGEP